MVTHSLHGIMENEGPRIYHPWLMRGILNKTRMG